MMNSCHEDNRNEIVRRPTELIFDSSIFCCCCFYSTDKWSTAWATSRASRAIFYIVNCIEIINNWNFSSTWKIIKKSFSWFVERTKHNKSSIQQIEWFSTSSRAALQHQHQHKLMAVQRYKNVCRTLILYNANKMEYNRIVWICWRRGCCVLMPWISIPLKMLFKYSPKLDRIFHS